MAKKKTSSKQSQSALEDMFAAQLDCENIEYFRQMKLVPEREFAVDFFFPQSRLCVEIQGGTWSGGRHTRGQGYHDDCEKQALLTIQGYRVIKADSKQVKSGALLNWTKQVLSLRTCRPIAVRDGKQTFAFPPKVLNTVIAKLLKHQEVSNGRPLQVLERKT